MKAESFGTMKFIFKVAQNYYCVASTAPP